MRAASFGIGAIALLLVAACSAKGSLDQGVADRDPRSDPGAEADEAKRANAQPSADAGSGLAEKCDLAANGLSFPAACMPCMQAKCCTETVACFNADVTAGAAYLNGLECTSLHKCLKACPGDSDAGSGADSGTAGSDGGDGGSGAGNPCKKACYDQHSPAVAAESAY